MNRAITAAASLMGYRRGDRRKATLALAVGIAAIVVGIQGHDRVRAQVPAPVLPQGLEPAPFQPQAAAAQFSKYEFMFPNLAYFYFTRDGRAVLQFPSAPPLVLQQ